MESRASRPLHDRWNRRLVVIDRTIEEVTETIRVMNFNRSRMSKPPATFDLLRSRGLRNQILLEELADFEICELVEA